MTDKDDYMNDADEEQQNEQKEKVLVPVRRHKSINEEELSVQNDEYIPFEAPRRWRIY